MIAAFERDSIEIKTGVFLGKMCSDRSKNHGFGQKKTGGTSSAMFGIVTAAKCFELKRCILRRADRIRWRRSALDSVRSSDHVSSSH